VQRRLAASGGNGADTPLERGDALLENGDGGVGDARVNVSGTFKVEQPSGLLGVVEHVGGRLIDGHGTGARCGIRLLAGMQSEGCKARGLRRGHG
jgi:hypothetical protein